MCMCKKCTSICGILFLVIGILFLLVDLEMWDFFGIQWWTALFLLVGLGGLVASKCPDCQTMRSGKVKK